MNYRQDAMLSRIQGLNNFDQHEQICRLSSSISEGKILLADTEG